MKIGDVFLVVGISIVVGVLSAYVMIASGVVVPEAVSSTQSAAGSFEGDSQEVNAQGITVNVDWEDIENVPTDLADGDADTRCDASGVCSQVCIGSDCKTAWTSGDSSSSSSGSGGDALATLEAMGFIFEGEPGFEGGEDFATYIMGLGDEKITMVISEDEHMTMLNLISVNSEYGLSQGIFLLASTGGGDIASVLRIGGPNSAIQLGSGYSEGDSDFVSSICFLKSDGIEDCISSWDELR